MRKHPVLNRWEEEISEEADGSGNLNPYKWQGRKKHQNKQHRKPVEHIANYRKRKQT